MGSYSATVSKASLFVCLVRAWRFPALGPGVCKLRFEGWLIWGLSCQIHRVAVQWLTMAGAVPSSCLPHCTAAGLSPCCGIFSSHIII